MLLCYQKQNFLLFFPFLYFEVAASTSKDSCVHALGKLVVSLGVWRLSKLSGHQNTSVFSAELLRKWETTATFMLDFSVNNIWTCCILRVFKDWCVCLLPFYLENSLSYSKARISYLVEKVRCDSISEHSDGLSNYSPLTFMVKKYR